MDKAMSGMQEILSLRQENSKTFDLGGGKRQWVGSLNAIHYKDNYANTVEKWKDIDLTWEGNRITKATYELTVDGRKLTFRDKKTGEVSTLELLNVKPLSLEWKIVPHNTGVGFQHTLSSDKLPFEAQFKMTGKAWITTRSFDDDGELGGLEVTYKNDILTEKLSQVKDALTGKVRPVKGYIRIDPTLTVQPSAKDNQIWQGPQADVNYGSLQSLQTGDLLNGNRRSILEFSLAGLPSGVPLIAATLGLNYYLWTSHDPVGKTIWAYKLTRTDWVELESTWNIYKTGSNWTAGGGDYVTTSPAGGSTTYPADYGWMSWNVLAIVQDAYDNTDPAEFLMRYADESKNIDTFTYSYWRSREYTDDTDLCPKLAVTYIAVPVTDGDLIGIAVIRKS